MFKYNYLNIQNADYIEQLFAQYQTNPDSVDETWRYFFDGIELGADSSGSTSNGHAQVSTPSEMDWLGEVKVARLIEAYRENGKWLADVDPINPARSSHPALDLAAFELTPADLTKTFQVAKVIGIGPSTLTQVIAHLKKIYCSGIAFEIDHIQNPTARAWLAQKIEARAQGQGALDTDTKKYILKRLAQTEGFERFLHTRYVAQKRFSIEGGDSTIPMLDSMIEALATSGSKEIIIGMAHRGRLNVLTHIMGKKYELMFVEFEGTYKVDPADGEGDVKYHKGYSRDLTTRQGKDVHLSLAFNPSHLEFVGAVVEGTVRAKQDRFNDQERTKVVPIVIHGDAALAGQGVCYEMMGFSQLEGYRTGGTLHIVINNQVGFTTSPKDARSSPYCTDVAKMLDAPILHVSGNDPDAVWWAAQLCVEYRQKFKSDTFIDLVCYRKHGHNEGDEPMFTQPLLYKKIKTLESPREVYAAKLTATGVLSAEQAQAMVDECTAVFIEAQAKARAENPQPMISAFEGEWKGLKKTSGLEMLNPPRTRVEGPKLLEISKQINSVPASFHLHPKLTRFFEARLKAVIEGKGLDWGNAESLAYASLVAEGHDVRLSGQDAERGTFTHRHSVVYDFETGQSYSSMDHMDQAKGRYRVHNSSLSETGIMAFEYGYALAAPKTLTIWEAQFGDFANGAQVIIDQFITTSESKWKRMNGLVLLLPHGMEGQGPEHSSARLERFLQLAGHQNMYVCNFSTPAQIFHGLRRQVKTEYRKPLVVMSPKSLLRHPMATSTLAELSEQDLQLVIDDPTFVNANAGTVKRVILCSGKIYYDLLAERTALKKDAEIALVRVEQLYPWPAEQLTRILSRYKTKDIVWCQEEARNMGAWNFVFSIWMGGLSDFGAQAGLPTIRYAGREWAASPAVGSHKIHEIEQKALLASALG